MLRLSPLSLEGLRLCVRPELAAMPAEDLEQIVESSVSAVPQGIAEDFMKQLGSLGKAAGPTLQRAAPDMAQGAATGASVGGPWGALIGAGAGLASSALSKPARPAASAPAVSPSATRTPDTPAAAALPTGQPAAATLVGLLQNPAVRQALLSQVLGSSGSQQVATATTMFSAEARPISFLDSVAAAPIERGIHSCSSFIVCSARLRSTQL